MRRATVLGVALTLGVLAGCDDPASLIDPKATKTTPAGAVPSAAVEPAAEAFNEEDYLVLLVAPDMWRDAGFSSLTRVRLAVLASSAPASEQAGSLQDKGQRIHRMLTRDEAACFRDLFAKADLPHARANPNTPGAAECGTYTPPAGAAKADLVTACPWEDAAAWENLAPMAGVKQIPTLSDALATVACDDAAVRAIGADWLLKARMDDTQRGAVANALQQAIKAPPSGRARGKSPERVAGQRAAALGRPRAGRGPGPGAGRSAHARGHESPRACVAKALGAIAGGIQEAVPGALRETS